MRKWKKTLSSFLAATLVMSNLVSSGMTAWAEQQVVNREISQVIKDSIATGSNAKEDSLATDSNAQGNVLATNSNAQQNIGLYSLLPLEEVQAYVYANKYSKEELKNMPLETFLSLLQDREGNPIEIPEDTNIVWTYFKDENGNILQEEYHVIGRGDTVDILGGHDSESNFTMEMIVGSGTQLDKDSIRYIIRVYTSKWIQEDLNFSWYRWEDNKHWTWFGTQYDWEYAEIVSEEGVDIPVTVIFFQPEEGESYQEEKKYRPIISSKVDNSRSDMKVNIYPMKNFLEYLNGKTLTGSITDKVLTDYIGGSYEDGYVGTYTMPQDLTADNVLCLVYTDVETGKVLYARGVALVMGENWKTMNGNICAYENGQMREVEEERELYNSKSWGFYPDGNKRKTFSLHSEEHRLKEQYQDTVEYYYTIEKNPYIEKVVIGHFESIQEADQEGAQDITKDVLPQDTAKIPYGYKIDNKKKDIELTVFYSNNMYSQHEVSFFNFVTNIGTQYSDLPVVNRQDPYFRVTGADSYNTYKDIYVVENGYNHTLDTLYGYGYQTLFLLDEEGDLAHLKPKFWTPEDVKVHSGEEQISGVSEQDFSDGPVYYQVHIGDALKNYQVTFVKKEAGAKLFVNGPDKREIFLDNYFENQHDILIANVGNEELTGLKAELLDPVHVKLDDYWVVGGEKNDTLSAFDTVYTSSSYSELANLAKIRLLPDGDGEISGTLKISADGQEDVYVELTGHAGNPKIITEKLDEAVKFVPYSYMVATDNMHDWNKVTFKIEEGKLPEGLTLYPATGEIYGVPQETGEFPIKVKATYSRYEFKPSYAEFVLKVNENTNENVYMTSDEGYKIEDHVGTEAGTYDFYVSSARDELFVSNGEFNEFVGFWLNGQKLEDGVDYTKDEGSTRITIKSQTFKNKAKVGSNTIAAEFRVDGDRAKEMKRTAQNFRYRRSGGSSGGSGNSGSSSGGSSSSGSTKPSTVVLDTTKPYTDESWVRNEIGWWCRTPEGSWLANTWYYLPYNGTMEWYYFDENGYMKTGWFEDHGTWYYLHPISDGTQGRMYTGWNLIDGKWYYFNEVSDGTKGAMAVDKWVGTYYVDKDGVWVP